MHQTDSSQNDNDFVPVTLALLVTMIISAVIGLLFFSLTFFTKEWNSFCWIITKIFACLTGIIFVRGLWQYYEHLIPDKIKYWLYTITRAFS